MSGQKVIGEPPGRIAPFEELVNTFELEAMAQRKLDAATFDAIAGSDRAAFDRMTFRPRLMHDATKLDLSTDLLGHTMFAPILIGPASQQKRFHPEGELAMARGAAAAKAVMVVAEQSNFPIEEIAAQAKSPLWYQVYPQVDLNRVQRAARAGCKAVCVTIGATGSDNPVTAGVDWSAIDRLRQRSSVPVVLKGVMSAGEARKSIEMGVQGLVVSNYSTTGMSGVASSLEMLPSIVEAVGGKLPILIDGSFRRGSDVLKALALGAQGVLVSRPALWGLAAYGAEGVRRAIELLQSELARDMAMCGKTTVKSIDRSIVKIHRR